MPRKRKSETPTTEKEPASAIAVAEPDHQEKIEEIPGFADRVGHQSERVAAPDPFKIAGDYLAGVHLFESRQDRQMAIKFDDKPGLAVIDKLKDSGYRWNPDDRVWAHPVRLDSAMTTRIEAERLYQDVRQMLRRDKGIEAAQDVSF
jgi:hypothetical protein